MRMPYSDTKAATEITNKQNDYTAFTHYCVKISNSEVYNGGWVTAASTPIKVQLFCHSSKYHDRSRSLRLFDTAVYTIVVSVHLSSTRTLRSLRNEGSRILQLCTQLYLVLLNLVSTKVVF